MEIVIFSCFTLYDCSVFSEEQLNDNLAADSFVCNKYDDWTKSAISASRGTQKRPGKWHVPTLHLQVIVYICFIWLKFLQCQVCAGGQQRSLRACWGTNTEELHSSYSPQGILSAHCPNVLSVCSHTSFQHTHKTQTSYPLIYHVPIPVSILCVHLYLSSCVKHFVTLHD